MPFSTIPHTRGPHQIKPITQRQYHIEMEEIVQASYYISGGFCPVWCTYVSEDPWTRTTLLPDENISIGKVGGSTATALLPS